MHSRVWGALQKQLATYTYAYAAEVRVCPSALQHCPMDTDTMATTDGYQVYPAGVITPFGQPTKLLTARVQGTYKSQQWCLVSDSGLQAWFFLMTYPDLKYAVAVEEIPGREGQWKTKLIDMTGSITTGQPIARPILKGTTFQLRSIAGGDPGLYWIESPYRGSIDSTQVVLAFNDGAVIAQYSQPPNAINIWKIERLPEGAQKFINPTPWPA